MIDLVSRRRRRPLRVCCAVLSLVVAQLSAQTESVTLATSPSGSMAVDFHSREGLLVRNWPASPAGDLVLGGGSEPRFDASGRLFFVRSLDRDHDEIARDVWVLEPGHTNPRRTTNRDVVPAWHAPTPTGGLDGAAIRITVDPGHGGSDPGALGNGLREADINLDVALRLQALLIADTANTAGGGEWNVLLTRSADTTVSLSARTNAANAFGADRFLSIHMNAFTTSTANGSETFCHPSSAASTAGSMRNVVHTELIAAWNRTDRGVKTADFFVLRNTAMPAVLLEGAFITNAGDAAVMADPAQRQILALHCLYALQQHHGFSRFDPGSGGGSMTGRLRGVLYDTNLGTGARIAGATVALADGSYAVSATDGYFEFVRPAGVIDYAATAPGFDFGAATRTITVGTDIWGSIGLAPLPGTPQLTVVPRSVAPGAAAIVSISGAAANAPAVLLLQFAPTVPPVDLSSIGLGTIWPSLAGLLSLDAGTTSAFGSRSLGLTSQSGGFDVHLQAAFLAGGAVTLSNGSAFTIR